MSGVECDGDQTSRNGARDDRDARRDAMQVEPEWARTGGNALNGAGYEGRKVADREDDDRGRKNRRRLKGAERACNAKQQDEAENSQKLMNDGKGQMQDLAREAHAKTRDENGSEEPADDNNFLYSFMP